MDNQLLDSDLLNSKEGKSLNDILLYGYETNSIGYIKRGYEIFQQNAGAFIGFTIISFFLRIIGAFIPFASLALIPLGFGINIIAKKIDKNEDYQFSNFFDGYQKFGPLVGLMLLQGLAIAAILLIAMVPFFLIFGINFSSLGDGDFGGGQIAIIVLLFLAVFIVMMFIAVAWVLSSQILIFNNNGIWESMEISRKIVSKKYFNWLGFLMLLGLLNFAGAICLLVGLLVTVPTSMCALYVAYEDVVGLNLKD